MMTDKQIAPSIKPGMLWLCCLCLLLLPCLAAFLLYGQGFPFLLKGPQFLTFYFIHMCIACGTLLLLKRQSPSIRTLCAWFLALTWLLALSRIAQGAIRHKPVGFLVLLLLLHSVLQAIIGGSSRKVT